MRSVSPLDWTLRPSRLQKLVALLAALFGSAALLLLTDLPPWWLVTVLLAVLGLEAWRWRRFRLTQAGRYLIRPDGFWQLPDSEALWQLKSVSWFPGLCQCALAEATRPGECRRLLFWRDQVDIDTWRRLKARLLAAAQGSPGSG